MLWIVLFHFTTRFAELFPNIDIPIQFENGGKVGVLFFFVISGFLLGKSLFESNQLPLNSVLKVIINKYWRLWSFYVFAVVIIYTVLCIFHLPGRTASVKEFLINLFLIYHPKIGYVDSAHWFIANLVVVQTILCLFIMLRREIRNNFIITYEVILIVILFANSFLHDSISSKLMWLLCVESSLKVLLGYNLSKLMVGGGKLSIDINVFVTFLLIVYYSFTISLLWVPIYTLILITALFISKPLNLLYSVAILGDYSFSWYLVHQNIGFIIILGLYNNGVSIEYSLIIAILTTFCLACILQFVANKLPRKIIK